MIITALLIYVLINLYVFFHINFFASELISTSVLFIMYVFFAGSFILTTFPMPERLRFIQKRVLKVIGSVFLGVFAFMLMAFLAFDVVAIIANLFTEVSNDFYKISGIILFSIVLFLSIYSARNATTTEVRKFSVDIDKPNTEVDRLKLLVVSDVHLGNLIGNKRLAKLITLINEQNPDAVLFAGDVLDGDYEPFKRENMAEQFTKINSNIAAFGVLGNHEYYGKKAIEFADAMSKAGVRMLLDEQVDFNGVQIVGRHDMAARSFVKPRKAMEELLADVDKTKAVILIDHKPDELEKASVEGADVTVSGHTHKGQIAPGHLVTRRTFINDWGYKKIGTLHTFVTAGYGTWGPPMRLGSKSEVFEIDLKFKK